MVVKNRARLAKRVPIRDGGDVMKAIEDLHRDHTPRILEREGLEVAVLLDVGDIDLLPPSAPTQEDIDRALKAAGSWRDVDTEKLKRYIYEGRRRGSRPSNRPA